MQQFQFEIPRKDEAGLVFSVAPGETLFLLGANGSGKSSLMHHFYSSYSGKSKRISAHRQTWLTSNAIELSPQQKRQTVQSILQTDFSLESRWLDHYAASRPGISLYELIDAQNVRARSIADAVDINDIDLAKDRSKSDAPIRVINELLQLSNIPIKIDVQKNEEVVARRESGETYSVAQLSDGERNALLVAADVLTVESGTLILIDEPERHLHRSIISPLLTELFFRRKDCAFIVSTHEVLLPLDNPDAKSLLVRGCEYSGDSPASWRANLIPPNTDVDDELKKDVLGARRKILFVEGTEESLDKPLYSLVFPDVSVIAKVSCRDVEHATVSIRGSSDLHWLEAYGVVDDDRRGEDDVNRLKEKGVYVLSVFSVESIYYHPELQKLAAERLAKVAGDSTVDSRIEAARTAVLEACRQEINALSRTTSEKKIRDRIFSQLPNKESIRSEVSVDIRINVSEVIAAEREELQTTLDNECVEDIISSYPIRNTPAIKKIVEALGFTNRVQYESAVRKLMTEDENALQLVRSLFGTLASDIAS